MCVYFGFLVGKLISSSGFAAAKTREFFLGKLCRLSDSSLSEARDARPLPSKAKLKLPGDSSKLCPQG